MYELQGNLGTAGGHCQTDPKILEYQKKIGLDIYKEGVISNFRRDEALMRADIGERKRLESYERRLELRAEAKERERALVEDLDFDENGWLLVRTKNTSIDSRPRIISNMRYPSFILFQHVDFTIPPCYMLSCLVGDKNQYAFLASDKLARGNYLVGKLTAVGIHFEIKPSKLKPLLLQLVGKLIEHCTDKRIVPEKPGWTKMNSGFTFYSKEDMTWEKIVNLLH